MNTSQIKTFAQQLRNQLREGVKQRLLYWGFNDQGEVVEQPETVEGGYMFRGHVYSDETVPNRWEQLKRTIDLHNVDYVVEEGAYTWFNRLMAIRILEKNDYIQPQLEYEEGTILPYLLQNARRGIFPEMQSRELDELKKQLRDNKDNEAFARLLTHYCDTQSLISSVFGKISFRDDYTEMLLPQNLLDQGGILEFIVNTAAITDEDFHQVELIGWLYQYYISEKKDQVFKSFKKRKKAGEEEIPAATQIFTPEWIVRYMVENTIGRLWFDLHPNSPLKNKMDYYVEPAEDNRKATPIISDVTELTLMDPASGSGHILVVGFEYLMDMYREEGYTARQSVVNILKDNIYGLELDERAAQLARFAVLLKAAKYDKSILDGEIEPQIYSFPEKASISTAELRELLGSEGEQFVDQLRNSIDSLQEGKNFGSTIQLQISEEAVDFVKQRMQILRADAIESLTAKALINKIAPYLNIIELLAKKYKAIAANPPYMGSRNMNSELKAFLKSHYPDTKKDLFAVFQEVLISLGEKGSKRGIINQWAWMCIDSYRKFRTAFLKSCNVDSLLHLGIGVFTELNTKKVQNVALVFDALEGDDRITTCFRLDKTFKIEEKRKLFLSGVYTEENLNELLKIPGSPLAFWLSQDLIDKYSNGKVLDQYVTPRQGLATGKNERFIRYWYEVNASEITYGAKNKTEAKKSGNKWFPYNKGGGFKRWYGNEYYVVNWENDGEEIKNFTNEAGKLRSRPQNQQYYFKKGITWSLISLNFSARYSSEGHIFDVGGSSGFPKQDLLYYSLALLNSKVSSYLLGALNFTLNVQVGDIKRILYIEPNDFKESIDEKTIELVELSKEEFNSYETSKDFNQNPLLSYPHNELNKLVESYSLDLINKLKDYFNSEKEINEKIIKIYGLEDELDPIPPYKNLTFHRDVIKKINRAIEIDLQEIKVNEVINTNLIIKDLISYIVGCIFGRYRVGYKGLYIANSNSDNPLQYDINGRNWKIDDDGLLPIIGKNSPFSDDITYRIDEFLSKVWGENNLTSNLNYIRDHLSTDLTKFMNSEFWEYHFKKYDKSPIYWLFSSKKGAFKVLAYMHRMDKYTVQKVRQNYLHPYIDHHRNEINTLEAKGSLQSDESKRLDLLRSKLSECLEYDEVIKKIAHKQIEIDLDDGVQYNYELFGDALAKI